jgi:hypothetical protein
MVLAQFASGAGNAFTVTGPAEGHDSALINAGINVQWTPSDDGERCDSHWSISGVDGVFYNGGFSRNQDTYGAGQRTDKSENGQGTNT